jgi:opine dehydrogenase
MTPIKTIAVLGAGHGGLAAAADLTLRGFHVRLHVRNPDRLEAIRRQGGIEVRGVHDGFVPFSDADSEVGEAVEGADVIMLVVPSVAHEFYARELAKILRPEIPVFLNPGHTGGGLHFVHELRKAGYEDSVQTCETVTLTYICRLEGPATVNIYSYTRRLAFAAFPGRNAGALFEAFRPVFPEIQAASSVLETALTNINAIFHPPGMVMNTGWIEHTGGDFLFYWEGITEGIGLVTAAVDAERLAVASALGVPTVSFLEAFRRAGLTTDAAAASGSISRACRESEPNRTIKSPQSLNHRYIHEDVGYGLVPISALGRLVGVPTPTIDSLVTLAGTAIRVDFWSAGLSLEKLGLARFSAQELPRFLETGSA